MVSEAQWEEIALEELGEQGWKPTAGLEIAPGTSKGRASWADIVLPERLLDAMRRLNPDVPPTYLEQARNEVLKVTSQDDVTENRRIHGFLVDGYRGINYVDADGVEQNPTIRLVSHREVDNRYLAVNQVTVRSTEHERRFDIVLYLNGLPVVIFELKKAGDPQATLAKAHAQLATYRKEFPTAFRCCVLTVVSDGALARYGTPFTPLNHYSPWNVDPDGRPITATSNSDDDKLGVELEYVIDGIANPWRFGQLLRDFVAFDAVGAKGYEKRVAKPHQYFAVTKAVGETVDATRRGGKDRGKAGVVWHTQGSGKSMEMELYAHAVAHHPALKNPTLVVVTDRTELDTQLFETFQRSELLGEDPVQVGTRDELRSKLSERQTGGILFTTLQKFGLTTAEREARRDHPRLSDRSNVVVIVDEAHRSHYEDKRGYARHIRQALPNASFIAFTGTPISMAGRDTVEVFGNVIDTYDLTRAVDDGATVPVMFDPRLIKVQLAGGVTEEDVDRAADVATAGLDDVERDRVEKSVAVINAVYGAPARLTALAKDIVEHWEQRAASMRDVLSEPDHPSSGKALIVGGTREICAKLYDEIVALRPDWHDDAIDRGVVKVVYSGSASDEPPVSRHVRKGGENKAIKNRLKDPDDPLQLVIVKDMLLTGFDAPPLHTLYLDRPLKGALLMQTLARVNRTFRGKEDGLLVGYAPLVENLKSALAEYTANDREREPVGREVDELVAQVRELIVQIDGLCAGYDWRKVWDPTQAKSFVKAVATMADHLRSPTTPGNEGGEVGDAPLARAFREKSSGLARWWALAGGAEKLDDVRREVTFYGEVRVWIAKLDAQARADAGEPVPEDIARLLAGLVATSTATGDIVDIYAEAGLPIPRLSDLGPDFVERASRADQAHLAVEGLRNLLNRESAKVARHNLVRQRQFSERITDLMTRYTNEQLTSAEVIAQLVELAREVAAEDDRGRHFDPPLSDDELAFYDAVSDNESAVEIQGADVLARIARDLVAVMRRDVKTDWTVRDDVRAKLRSSIKRLLVKHKYPPDQQPAAIALVIEQMEAMAPRYVA